MKNIILLTLIIANVLSGQKLKLGDTDKMIEFSHSPKKISIELQSGGHKEMIWSKLITYRPNSNELAFKSTVYPTTVDSRVNPYKGAKIIHADFKDLGNDSSMCLVLIEIDYSRSAFLTARWIGPVLPKKYGYRPITILGDVYGKKNYLLRSFVKNEGKWQPYLSCYLESVWYDLIGVPFEQIRIRSKNNYAVVYKHGRRLVKNDAGSDFISETPESGFEEDDGGDVIVDGKLIRKTLMNTKAPVTRELVYNDKVEFLQVKDSGKLKYAVKAVWWKGFDEFDFARRKIDKNSRFLSEKDKMEIEKAKKDQNYFKVRQTQKNRLPDTAAKYEPPVIRVADKYMNTLFDIVKFQKGKGRKPFTKEEIVRLANAKFKDENDPRYKNFIEIKLSKPSYSTYVFYE